MSRSELASMIESLGEYQIEELCRMAEGFLSLNEELNDTTPKICPRCKSETARFIKKGIMVPGNETAASQKIVNMV